MDNHDKIFEHFKKAAENQEAGEFPSMDKVWSRVEDKLDHKVLKKENTLWKKIAIAASLLLLFTLGYEWFKTEPQNNIPENNVVVSDTLKRNFPEQQTPQKAIVAAEEKNPLIKPEVETILEKQLAKPAAVAISEKIIAAEPENDAASEITVAPSDDDKKAYDYNNPSKRGMKRNAFDAVGVKHKYEEKAVFESEKTTAKTVVQKEAPLLVVDGKPMTTKNSSAKAIKDGLSKLDRDEVDEIVVLKEPLYIIDGHYYSELELFGPNPTSPYAPLNQQEIETLLVLQGEKAIKNYGERGRKGVVIITTKNGKPVSAVQKGP